MRKKIYIPIILILMFNIDSVAQVQVFVWGGVNNSSFGGNPPEDASFSDIRGLAFGSDFDFQPTGDFVITLY